MRRTRDRRVAIAGLAAAVCALVLAAVAFGAVGDLTPLGCIDDPDSGADTCATSGDGARSRRGDRGQSRRQVGLRRLEQRRGDRALLAATPPPARSPTRAASRARSRPRTVRRTVPGSFLINAVDVAVSPDGKAVYVISRFGDSGIYHFARNTDERRAELPQLRGRRRHRGVRQEHGRDRRPDGRRDQPRRRRRLRRGLRRRRDRAPRVNATNGNLNPKECVIENDGEPVGSLRRRLRRPRGSRLRRGEP